MRLPSPTTAHRTSARDLVSGEAAASPRRAVSPGIGRQANVPSARRPWLLSPATVPRTSSAAARAPILGQAAASIWRAVPVSRGSCRCLRRGVEPGIDSPPRTRMRREGCCFILSRSLAGPIPPAVGNLSNLESLVLDSSEFSGPIPYEVGLLKKLTLLRIRSCSISGSIPNSISNLTRLIVLDLSSNVLNGEFPTSVFDIPTLQRLRIKSNQISGSIQDFNATSSHLVSVDLSTNKLTGNIPRSFFQLTSLAYIDIGSNNFVGLVDLSLFWRLGNLVYLRLSNNNLSVTDMAGEGNSSVSTFLPQVTKLELASCNLMGFPSSLAQLNQITYLDLSCNRMSGAIPEWTWTTWNRSLTYLNLSHNMLSIMQINSYVLPFSQLEVIDLSYNQLQGQMPMTSPPAPFLDYSNNNFSSVLPNFTLYVGYEFRISKNSISGHIPNSVCDSRILVLDLSSNNFSGRIPSCLIEDGNIAALILRNNQFEGVLPNNIKDECMLHTLDLNNNNIEGKLPMALTKCLDLEVIDLGNNHMLGTFPSWLGKLPRLHVLILRSNRFYGSMGDDRHRDDKSGEYFSTLQILDLASNNFSGNLSPKWFEGMKSMMAEFNTTGNAFTGDIPPGFGGMTQLESLDLFGNQLSGDIPEALTNLTFLGILNLCNNQLVGRIPQSGQFSTFQNSSFEGNLGLCGPPLSNPCGVSPAPPSSVHADDSSHVDVILFLFAGIGFGVGFAAAILVRRAVSANILLNLRELCGPKCFQVQACFAIRSYSYSLH